VAALYDRRASGVDVAAMLLVNLYRWWGYAPDLLAVGLAGFNSFGDHDVLADRAQGRSIPLDSVVRTLDFKRQDPRAAAHHAASFVRWLMRQYGDRSFRDLYDKSTDLSLRRAMWSVYGKTLGELEQEWLAYLKKRQFTRDELQYFAERARFHRRYEEYVSLLQETAHCVDTVDERLTANIGIAQAHLGRWRDAVGTFRDLVRVRPDTAMYRWLLAEALSADGDQAGAAGELGELQRRAPNDPRPFLRLGDAQYEQRRRDSAAVLWRRGLDVAKGNRMTLELLLRLAHYEAGRRGGPDAALPLLASARQMADQAIGVDPSGPDGWIFGGEALLGLDSLETAIAYLQTAAYLADAPIDLGRIHLGLGACYDRDGNRRDAVAQYEQVLALPATASDRRWAQYYINKVYRY
jgi:tetratricopeptide (TPR) repeat protein